MFLGIHGVAATVAEVSGWDYVLGGFLLAVLLIAGAVTVQWVRRRYHPSNVGGVAAGATFDIDRLERMRQDGLITQEEFRTLRRAALGLDMEPSKADNSTSSAPGGDDDEVCETESEGPAEQADEDANEPDKEL